ncbi:DUF881 domain-containing protein [Nocardioides acrostichi]|uniref:DUF881 domain-containing protein n=1 Tax=Nocardioides acrostichi TaxID=2784339 RepID=A0A930Y7T6_9ACTN|nr:DUF881 domain-containing protein [Nocardioides acrostichi]MBF4163775.1 DUF881 domain-containing protein [Nocardioides acrostichi]
MPEPTPEQEPQSTARRILTSLRRPGRRQLVVGVVLAIVSFGVVTQIRAAGADDTYAGYREQDLVDVLSGLAGASRRARSEISRLEDTRDQLVSDQDAEKAALEQATKEGDTLSILAGQVPVTGPGIRITIKEVTGRVSVETMVDMIQGLRNAGAEAIQVNGTVRLIAQSSFTATDAGLLVDGQQLSAPYVVDVIGDASSLTGAMSILDGPRVALQSDGADVQIEQLASLDIEAVRQPVEPEFAQPDDAQ